MKLLVILVAFQIICTIEFQEIKNKKLNWAAKCKNFPKSNSLKE